MSWKRKSEREKAYSSITPDPSYHLSFNSIYFVHYYFAMDLAIRRMFKLTFIYFFITFLQHCIGITYFKEANNLQVYSYLQVCHWYSLVVIHGIYLWSICLPYVVLHSPGYKIKYPPVTITFPSFNEHLD